MTRTREAYSQALPFVGFAISKNYSKLAVKRNHIKRQLREIYRHYRQPENKKTSLKNIGLLVIGVIPQGSSVPYASLKSELETLLDNGLQYYCDLYN